MKSILINASNLHNGGGVQVATSFISELAMRQELLCGIRVSVVASSAVDANLKSSGVDVGLLPNYSVVDVHGLQAMKPSVAKMYFGFDLVFTVFGPLYTLFPVPNHVVGFAQPWIIYPDNEISSTLGLKAKLIVALKFALQWQFFKRARRLVVELSHVKERLVTTKSIPSESVDVVSNCVSSIYFDEARWLPVPKMGPVEGVRLGFVTRDYPHKNVGFLLLVLNELRKVSDIPFTFYVTLSDAEWNARSDEFKSAIRNVGSITVAQCPSFYRSLDGVVFPSLLECFSATPIEAMVMKVPLFASDRGFVRDCCGEHAVYIDPMDAKAAANAILAWFSSHDVGARNDWVDAAYRHVLSLPNSRDRAAGYVDVITSCLR